ncbi:AmiR/NasT family two-component response regulator [Enterococcus sp. PF1-24]|uniref:ANTAR domain-containing response regulator n=1 Tax=unclassified Enterococcus TaxID=2608891 RepID=UPI00247647DD|nr:MULTISPECIES: response regulator [unclassified Enterococcus]MDH6363332.1 AmiR/NasT family two-component response regulator [Enterococcus sp. PFB1-1]MDH6400367.1 AmiR/NasT family two-component response regulator [Enterococcus sp. PF1-24]
MNGRIVVVDDEPITRVDICDILHGAGYEVVGEAADGFEAIEICKKTLPDVVLMDIQMPVLDGLKAGKKIIQDQSANSIVFLSAYSDTENTSRAKKLGAIGYLVKPLDEKSLIPTLEMSIARGQENRELLNEIEKLKMKLEERKVIEKAKGILSKENNLSEADAYQMIRKLSMDKRCPMSEIAELIVMSDE